MQAVRKKKVRNVKPIVIDIIVGVASCVICILMISYIGIDFFVKLTNTL